MLFSIWLILLITPVPGRQTTAYEKSNSTGSDTIKSDAILTSSILKTVAALAKQNFPPKPNTANQTLLTALTVKQKPLMVNGTNSMKMKKASTVSQATLSTSPKTLTISIKDKHTINKTFIAKTSPTSDVTIVKKKIVTTVTAIAAKTAKNKLTASTNQTISIKSPAIGKSGPTVIQQIQATPTPSSETVTDKLAITVSKTASKDKQTTSVNQTTKQTTVSGTTITKEKFSTSVNQTSTSNARSTKDKSATTNPTLTTKDKPTTTANYTALIKPQTNSDAKANKVKLDLKAIHTASSDNVDNKDQHVNHTQTIKAPAVTSGVKDTEKPSSTQPIKIVISEGCDSSHTMEQDVKLKPGSPLVVTHKISLVPAGCSESCQAEMEALKARLDRLEKEMTARKDQCPDCSKCAPGANCETKGDKGKFKMNIEAVPMKITEDKNTKAEQSISQKKDQTVTLTLPVKVSKVKTKARQQTAKTNIRDSAIARKTGQPTVGQILLKQKGKKQEEARIGRTTVLTGKELAKSEAEQVVMKVVAVAKAHANSGQLQDQPQTNDTLGVMKVTNGTAKILPILTKVMETSNRNNSLHPSTLAEKDVTQSPANTLIKKIKTGSVNASNVVQIVDNTKTPTSKIGSGKVMLSSTTASKDKQGTSANQVTSVKAPSSDVKTITKKPAIKVAKAVLPITVTGGTTIGEDKQASAVDQITSGKTHSSNVKPAVAVARPAVWTASKTVTTSGTTVNKDKQTASVNQKTSVKTSSNLKPNTEKTILTVVRTTQSRETKLTSMSGATTITKDKFTSDVTGNQSADAKSTKDTPAEHHQLADSKSTTSNATFSTKDKPMPTANHTAFIKSSSDEKAANTQTSKIGSGKAKGTQRSQYLVNATSVENRETSAGDTTTQQHTSRRSGGGLGSVKVSNVSSYSFTLTWSAPPGMFKNFTVIRREQRVEAEGTVEQEAVDRNVDSDDMATTAAKNMTAVQTLRENTDIAPSSVKATSSRGKAEERVSMVLPGNVRSVEFVHLQANTRYFLQVFGTAPGRRSKIHRISTTTGPEPATELVFSNVTESSVTLSWSKPKSTWTGFRVRYTNSITGESSVETVEPQRSHVVLSQLGAGSSYIITITSVQGNAESDALTSLITTVPSPPAQLRAVNVMDTRALLKWTPSLGTADRFIISYESAKIPNVTVTVMVSGGAADHQLRALQRGTEYTVKALSQKNGLQSAAASTTFTTASTVKASAVGPRSAVIKWSGTSSISYQRYKMTYRVAGEESKEVILDHTITEYRLTRLLPMTRYVVLIQGERDGQFTSIVTTEFVTGKLRFPCPADCSEEQLNGALQSGEVDIYPNGKAGGAYRVYCDMETDGGGWTVFQRRMNGNTDFYRTWNEYSVGFGNISQEFWLGNELLHNLTRTGSMGMRVDLRAENETAYAHYSKFTVDSEEHHYSVMLSGFTGTAGDSMRYHNGRPFSTHDKDPESLGIHCARAYMGGWWYKNCYKTNLNGLYNVSSNNQGVVWIDWKGKDSSLPSTEMKIRPAAFSPSAPHG